MNERVAVLDVDGTLIPGSLGLGLLRALADRRLVDPDAIAALFAAVEEQRAGRCSYADMVESTTASFAAALRGALRWQVERVARGIWGRRRESLFDFVRPLVERLRRAGLTPVIVSSSPQEIVALLAADLEIVDVVGSRFSAPEGRYDGACALMPGRAGGKIAALRAELAAGGRGLDLAGSLALGNAPSDLSVLEAVGTPIAFEPVAELQRVAEARGWRITDRQTILGVIDIL